MALRRLSAPSSLAFAVALALQFVASQARLEAGTVQLSTSADGTRWQYLGKFGYAIGSGTYDVRVRIRQPDVMTSVNLEVFLDEDWADAQAMEPCRRSVGAPARARHVLRADSEWGPWMQGLLEQNVRPHIWYFALSKCLGNTSLPQGDTTFDVDYQLRSLQHDGSELSIEQRHMPMAIVISVLFLSAYLVRFVLLCRRFRQSAGEVHLVIRILAVAISLQWLAHLLHLLHLQVFEQDGVGQSFVDLCASMLFMLSQVVSSTLLISIAHGYTLFWDAKLDSVKPIALAISVLHVILVGQCKLRGDHSDKHHENEGVIGWALLVARLVLYGWFVKGIGALREQGGVRLHGFLHNFQFAGSVYFLSYPAIFFVVKVFAPYLQHPVMQLGLVIMQTASALWLSDLFLTRGTYFKVSTLSSSLLPGGLSGAPSAAKQA